MPGGSLSSANKRRPFGLVEEYIRPNMMLIVGICVCLSLFVTYTMYGASSAASEAEERKAVLASRLGETRTKSRKRSTSGAKSGIEDAFALEVLDSLDKLETLSKGMLKSQLSLEEKLAVLQGEERGGEERGGEERSVDCPKQPLGPPAASVSRRKNAVIGLAKNIDFVFLYRFVRSLREHMSAEDVDVVLFTDVNQNDADFQWLFKTYNVNVIHFEVDTLPPSYRNYHPSSYRWILIRDWMAKFGSEVPYAAVFFTDVRDTVFQSDPFHYIEQEGFYAFQEAKPGTIANCGWNSGWVKDCFGEAGLQQVGSNIISCSGTSMATWQAGFVYANLVAEEIATNKCERNGVDQGMHNYFVYSGKLAEKLGKEPVLVSNEEGWIATVQSMPVLHRDRGGHVLNENRERVAVVHQYDRSSALKEQYDRQFIWLATHELERK